MKVIGISGYPIPNSNTDRALKAALDATGMDSVGINDFKDQEIALEAAKQLGRNKAEFLNSNK